MTKAIAYLRTSSAANVGQEKDSEKRQRAAIHAYAEANSIEIVAEFYDMAVSGADPVQDRPGFAAMLNRIEGNGVRMILVEDASRFARDLLVQEAGLAMLAARGVRVLTATGEDMTATDDPLRKMMRQIVGAVVEAEKARLVLKLRGARDRKSAALGHRVEGGKTRYEYRHPEAMAALRRLRAANPVITLAELADGLCEAGIVTSTGKKLAITQVRRLLARS